MAEVLIHTQFTNTLIHLSSSLLVIGTSRREETMADTSNVLNEARALVQKRLRELDQERARLERALADLTGGRVGRTLPSDAFCGRLDGLWVEQRFSAAFTHLTPGAFSPRGTSAAKAET